MSQPTDQRHIEYLPLDQLRPALRNPKRHNIATLRSAIARFGFTVGPLLDERTGRLVAGHGRLEALAAMRDEGEAPPAGVRLAEDGSWLIPVQRGWASRSDAEAEAYLVADNRLSEVGGWETTQLAELLADINEIDPTLLEATGYNLTDLDELLLGPDWDGLGAGSGSNGTESGDSDAGPGKYTGKVDSIQYQIRGECPPVAELVDTRKASELLIEIEQAENVPDEVRKFLRLAAQRHLVFDYAKIAEFYAHAEPHVQRLMERSALVIIDFDDAIDYGYVQLSKTLDELRLEQQAAEEGDDNA